jgi:hypothetical protein
MENFFDLLPSLRSHHEDDSITAEVKVKGSNVSSKPHSKWVKIIDLVVIASGVIGLFIIGVLYYALYRAYLEDDEF